MRLRMLVLVIIVVLTGVVENAKAADVSPAMTERIYLSGKGPSDAVEWDFHCSSGRRSGQWTTIPVPSNWEQHGFGGYDYGHVQANKKHAEVGVYRKTFFAPKAWETKTVRLVFEASMTDTTVKINGQQIGATNLGGYHPFSFLLSDDGGVGRSVLRLGQDNELEVHVAKKSSNDSVEFAERSADYWVFGGIYRPVYLEILPKAFINRVAIDAKADGTFKMDVFPIVHKRKDSSGTDFVTQVAAQIETTNNIPVGPPMASDLSGHGGSRIRLSTEVDRPALWSPEFPNLYQVRIRLMREETVVHETVQRFGFRTFDVRPGDGLYLNGKKIRIQGVNRNTFRPDTARALDPQQARADAKAIKAMNANLVRSHLPASRAFMDACDELGLMVISELTNWQVPYIDTPVARNIAYSLVTHYQNYPSVVFWANGNEGGFNYEVDDLFAVVDLQGRHVLHPWDQFDRINTLHYPDFKTLTQLLAKPDLYMPTEFLHGLYDGGHGAGLEDYWNAIIDSPAGAGGVLWCWADAAILRTDLDGKLDTDGNHSADGIVGPYGEKEASYYTIREIWSPIQIPLDTLPADFAGTLPVENRYVETNLNQCLFTWRLVHYPGPFDKKTSVIQKGTLQGPSVQPGKNGSIQVPLPAGWRSVGGLEVTAENPDGLEVMRWAWRIDHPGPVLAGKGMEPKLVKGNVLGVEVGGTKWNFSSENGQLLSVVTAGKELGLKNGPVLYAATEKEILKPVSTWTVNAEKMGKNIVISSTSNSTASGFSWTFNPGGAVELVYSFSEIDYPVTYCAIGFDLDEKLVKSKRWLGDGPYRIWNNRRKGVQFGLWENDYNDGLAGYRWELPEFKGVFGNVEWMRLDLATGQQLLLNTQPGNDIGILRPFNTKDAKNATWSYPQNGGLFLFHKVPAVGTKFKPARALGPQSAPEKMHGKIEGKLLLSIHENELGNMTD